MMGKEGAAWNACSGCLTKMFQGVDFHFFFLDSIGIKAQSEIYWSKGLVCFLLSLEVFILLSIKGWDIWCVFQKYAFLSIRILNAVNKNSLWIFVIFFPAKASCSLLFLSLGEFS